MIIEIYDDNWNLSGNVQCDRFLFMTCAIVTVFWHACFFEFQIPYLITNTQQIISVESYSEGLSRLKNS